MPKKFKSFFIVLSTFVLAVLVVYKVVSVYEKNKIDVILNAHTSKIETFYNILIHQQKRISDIAYEQTMQNEKFLELFKKANIAYKNKNFKLLNKLRDEAISLLDKKYFYLKQRGILQYHFVFPDNVVFLRMHKVSKFGDDLTKVRTDFAYVNKNLKIIRGFTQGRTSHAFRNVYPIIDQEKTHLGAVEISFSSEFLQKYFTEVSNIHTHFLVRKDIFDSRTWERDDLVLKYHQSSEHPNYMITMTDEHTIQRCINQNKTFLKPILDEIDQKISRNNPFSLYTVENDRSIVVSFYPVAHAITKEPIAWVVSYEPDTLIQNTINDTQTVYIGSFIALFLLFTFVYFILVQKEILKQQTNSLIEQKNLLADSEFRWKFAVDGKGDGLWDWNVKTNEVYFSPKWKSMLGFKEDEIEASLDEWKNRIHPEDLEKVYEDINKHMDGITKVYSNEHRVKCKDSTYKWIHDRGIVVQKDENGEAIRLIGTHTDITTRKENEFKMKQALTVFENTNEGIMITNSKNEIINVNPSFCKTTGYSLEEIKGKNPSILKSNTADNEFYKNMWKEINNNGFWQGEIINKRKNGEIYEEYLSINTIKNSDGSINSFIGIFSDISILKQQEKMILQQSRTSAIGEMIGNIAHQWRQPLSVISTAATGLKLQLEMGMDVKRVDELDTLDKINEQTQHLSRTIEDFRGFFRDDISIEIETEISKTITKVNDLTKDSFKINFVQMNLDIEKNVYFNVNQNLLIQALLNIYNNALDALKERNHKRVIFISAKKDNDTVKIRIKDNAGGIPKQYMEKIFDPYFTTKHQSQGTGIGLYMTHQIIVKQLKGTITVENVEYDYNSEKYTGAEFTITLK